jgi:hypothetical protein
MNATGDLHTTLLAAAVKAARMLMQNCFRTLRAQPCTLYTSAARVGAATVGK